LQLYFPQILQWFDDVTTPLVGDLLERWPTLEQLRRVHPGMLRRFFHEHNCRSEKLNRERIDGIYQAMPATKDSAVLEAGVTASRGLVAWLAVLRRNIAAFEERIAELVRAHPDGALFASLPGAGPVLVPRLIVAFGTRRERYGSAAKMQNYSGISPVMEASGKSAGAFPAGLSQVSTPDVSRVRRSLDRAVGVGQGLLRAPTQPREEGPSCRSSVAGL
jgi:hypothetical protein